MKHVLAAFLLSVAFWCGTLAPQPTTINPMQALQGGDNVIVRRQGAGWFIDIDTAKVPTRATLMNGLCTFLQTTLESNQTIFDTTLAPCGGVMLYQTGMTFVVKFDARNTVNAALNIDALGPVALRAADGSPLPAGTIVPGSLHLLSYDGTYFRVLI